MRPAISPAMGPPAPPDAPAMSVASAAWMGFWAGDDDVGGVEWPLEGRVGGRGSCCGGCGGDGVEVVVTAAVETVGGDWIGKGVQLSLFLVMIIQSLSHY